MAPTNRDVLEELRLMLLVKEVRVSPEERAARSLDGLPLRIEEERRTEQLLFELAYALLYDDENGRLSPGLQAFAHADQRAFELEEFTGTMRLERIGEGRLPSYVLAAHARLLVHTRSVFRSAA